MRKLRNCNKCNKPTHNPKYCSSSCAASVNNRNKPKRIRKRWYCVDCSRETKTKRKRCKHCHEKRLLINGTIGDVRRNSKTLKGQYMRAVSRQQYIKSPRPKCCVVCGYGYFDVCHIKSIQSFPDNALVRDINHFDNLISLCPNHHKELDLGLLDLSTLTYWYILPLNDLYSNIFKS